MQGQIWIGILPMILTSVGIFLKGKDENDKGSDDFIGDLCICIGNLIQAHNTSNLIAYGKEKQRLLEIVARDKK